MTTARSHIEPVGRSSRGRAIPRRRAGAVGVIGAALLLVTAGCGSSAGSSGVVSSGVVSSAVDSGVATAATSSAAATTTSAAPATAASTATPSGLKPIDETELNALVAKFSAEHLIPGAQVLLRDQQGQYVASYGTTQIGTQTPPTPDTHVRIASVSKMMTGASILLMAQEGKLALDDPISKYVPEVPNGDNIMLKNLLQMRSGLYDYTGDPAFSSGMDADHTRVWTPAELLAMGFSHPPNFAPDTDHEYSNTNFVLLGLVAEKVDGKPLATVLQDRVFGPLGMSDSFMPAVDSTVLPDPFSHGYLYGSSAHVFGPGYQYTPEEQAAAHDGTLLPIDYTDLNATFGFGTGGCVSTTNDLATFVTAYVGGGLLDPEYQAILLDSVRPEQADAPAGGLQLLYGYGLSEVRWADNAIEFHGGEMPGFNLFVGYDRTNKLTIVTWVNLTLDVDAARPNGNNLNLQVLDLIYAISPLASAASAGATPSSPAAPTG